MLKLAHAGLTADLCMGVRLCSGGQRLRLHGELGLRLGVAVGLVLQMLRLGRHHLMRLVNLCLACAAEISPISSSTPPRPLSTAMPRCFTACWIPFPATCLTAWPCRQDQYRPQ